MMTIHLLHFADPKTHSEFITKSRKLYESAFPPSERRPTDNWINKINNEPAFAIYFIVDEEQQFLGFVTLWNFDCCSYIEHFATLDHMRGQGIGGRAIDMLRALELGKCIILEAEPPETPMAIRRIEFYKRHGFRLLDYKYIQPPYSPENVAIPLKLMTNIDNIEKDQIENVVSTIKRRVYEFPAK